MLESLKFAQARGANILAEVIGYACTNDAADLLRRRSASRAAARRLAAATYAFELLVQRDVGADRVAVGHEDLRRRVGSPSRRSDAWGAASFLRTPTGRQERKPRQWMQSTSAIVANLFHCSVDVGVLLVDLGVGVPYRSTCGHAPPFRTIGEGQGDTPNRNRRAERKRKSFPIKFNRPLLQRNSCFKPRMQPCHGLRVTRFARALIVPPCTEPVGGWRQWPSK